MFAIRARYDIVRSLWDRSQISAVDEQEFDAWCMLRFDAYTTMVAVAIVVVSGFFGFVDGSEIPGLPGVAAAFDWARITFGAASVLFCLLPRTRLVMRHLVLFYGLLTGAAIFVAMSAFARLGGPDQPYVHLFYAAPVWTVALPMRLRARAALSGWWGAAMVGAVFVTNPEYSSQAWAQEFAVHMAANVIMGVALGQYVQTLYRRTFEHTQLLARRGDVLAEKIVERTLEVRHLVSHVQTAQETERTRIVRDLHDDLGQELTALNMVLQSTQRRFAVAPTDIGPNLTQLRMQLGRAITSMQAIMGDLRPRILDELGFIAAAKWLGAQVAERAALAVDVVTAGSDAQLTPAHSAAAFRILQEALTNVVKHAEATRVTVTVSIDTSSLTLTVADNGGGLSGANPPDGASEQRPAGGLGMISMRERAAELGGTLVVRRAQSGGVEVFCQIPVCQIPIVDSIVKASA